MDVLIVLSAFLRIIDDYCVSLCTDDAACAFYYYCIIFVWTAIFD
ncbi:MAG: hypothetical protein WA432_02350 [Candidatus Babeliaceae bacterium]